jgi:hypothetical protein
LERKCNPKGITEEAEEEEDEGGAGVEAQSFRQNRQERGRSSHIHRKLVK